MAITAVTYLVIRSAFNAGVLPKNAPILEFGEANWYKDVPPETLLGDVDAVVQDPDERAALKRQLKEVIAKVRKGTEIETQEVAWQLPKIFYRMFFGSQDVVSIDLHGTETSLKLDLNQPFDLGRQFPVTVNNGTAEHIFNVGQFFASVHRCTAPNGLMIHEGPLINGWVDHGFVNFQPTLFFDMARANRYKIEIFCIAEIKPLSIRQLESREQIVTMAEKGEIPKNPAFFVILRKDLRESDFAFPIQGYYTQTISQRAQKAWQDLR
jgi:hypothetical protein